MHLPTAFSRVEVLGVLSLALAVTASNAAAGSLRASVVKIDITPDKSQWLLGYGPRQSTGVHDHLFHRIVAMDDGKTQFFLVSTDLAVVSPSFYDDVARDLQKELGIEPLQVWWTTTHTHSAPEVGPAGLPAVFMGERYKHEPNLEYSGWVKSKTYRGDQGSSRQTGAGAAWSRLGIRDGEYKPPWQGR